MALPAERILHAIHAVRGERVLLDADLAALYGVETRVMIQAVKRNLERFPRDFMFQLTEEEWHDLRSQSVISSSWGGRRSAPYAFTELGVAMLSSVLNSERAIQVNISIMRTFTQLRVRSEITLTIAGGQPRDPTRRVAKEDVVHPSSHSTQSGARLTPALRVRAAGFPWRRRRPLTWNHHASGPPPCHARPALRTIVKAISERTLRGMLATHADLAHKMEALERKYDGQFRVVFEAIRELMMPQVPAKKPIGFRPKK